MNTRRPPVAALSLFLLSAAAIPIWEEIGASLSGERYFGQGLEGSLYSRMSGLVHGLSFLGFAISPVLTWQPLKRQAILSVGALGAFLVDEFLSFVFIMFMQFPD